eukprot:6481444-Amphidinium_carterae.1
MFIGKQARGDQHKGQDLFNRVEPGSWKEPCLTEEGATQLQIHITVTNPQKPLQNDNKRYFILISLTSINMLGLAS